MKYSASTDLLQPFKTIKTILGWVAVGQIEPTGQSWLWSFSDCFPKVLGLPENPVTVPMER